MKDVASDEMRTGTRWQGLIRMVSEWGNPVV